MSFFTVWSRAHLAGWPSVWSGSAVLVSLLAHTLFVPCYLSAFLLLLIRTSTSVAGMNFDHIAGYHIGYNDSNLEKKRGGVRMGKGMWQLSSLSSVLFGSANFRQRNKTK